MWVASVPGFSLTFIIIIILQPQKGLCPVNYLIAHFLPLQYNIQIYHSPSTTWSCPLFWGPKPRNIARSLFAEWRHYRRRREGSKWWWSLYLWPCRDGTVDRIYDLSQDFQLEVSLFLWWTAGKLKFQLFIPGYGIVGGKGVGWQKK